ncbi:MFS transporter [Asaia krungthepensis]|uniref:Major facilitator superfamily transporter n=1 Tax=Asaia krungthepensis NRIC 0535 TaxID=1307925 RepID=A0ABQ0Q221_9PROT|nr:MFS transporter [Asaia krungthepensis]GBQ87630.1 major facilitator superfamily transporter [Asaia krungthepensis NRIC 0535]
MPRLRWLMIILCFAATTINYIDRATIAIAAPFMARELHIDPALLGVILGGFFWTYAFMQLPFGMMVDRFGVRATYAFAVTWWSVCTALTALVRGPLSIFGLRLALGIGEAGSYPANAKVASLWFPKSERGLAAGIFDSGSRAGSAVSMPLVALLIAWLGWRMAFVAAGALGLVWVAIWFALYHDPDRHTGVSAEALARLRAAQPVRQRAAPGSWRRLLRHRTVWGMMLGFFCANFVFYFFATWFPSYLVSAHGFSLRDLGLIGMIPGVIAIPAAWLGGWTSDRLYSRGWSLTAARKTCLVGGLLLSSVIALTAFVSATWLCILLLSVSFGGIAFTGANIWSLLADIAPSPDLVATLGGMQNSAANIAGIVIASFTGLMVSLTHGSFLIPLCATGIFGLLGALSYLFIVGPIAPLPMDENRESRRRSPLAPRTQKPC